MNTRLVIFFVFCLASFQQAIFSSSEKLPGDELYESFLQSPDWDDFTSNLLRVSEEQFSEKTLGFLWRQMIGLSKRKPPRKDAFYGLCCNYEMSGYKAERVIQTLQTCGFTCPRDVVVKASEVGLPKKQSKLEFSVGFCEEPDAVLKLNCGISRCLGWRKLGVPCEVDVTANRYKGLIFYYGFEDLVEKYLLEGLDLTEVDDQGLRPYQWLVPDIVLLKNSSSDSCGKVLGSRQNILFFLRAGGFPIDENFDWEKWGRERGFDYDFISESVSRGLNDIGWPKQYLYRSIDKECVFRWANRIVNPKKKPQEIEPRDNIRRYNPCDAHRYLPGTYYLAAAFYNGFQSVVSKVSKYKDCFEQKDKAGLQGPHYLFVEQDDDGRLYVSTKHNYQNRRETLKILYEEKIEFDDEFSLREPYALPEHVGTYKVRDLLGPFSFIWRVDKDHMAMPSLAPDKEWASTRLAECISENGLRSRDHLDYFQQLVGLGGNPKSVKTNVGLVPLLSALIQELNLGWSNLGVGFYELLNGVIDNELKDGEFYGDLSEDLPALLRLHTKVNNYCGGCDMLRNAMLGVAEVCALRRKKGQEPKLPSVDFCRKLFVYTGLVDTIAFRYWCDAFGAERLKECFEPNEDGPDLLDNLLDKKFRSDLQRDSKACRENVRRTIRFLSPYLDLSRPVVNLNCEQLYPSKSEALKEVFGESVPPDWKGSLSLKDIVARHITHPTNAAHFNSTNLKTLQCKEKSAEVSLFE